MHFTDSHAHLDMFPGDELAGVLARAGAAQARTILAIGIGDGPATMHRALDLADALAQERAQAIAQGQAPPQLPTVYASAGIHPQEAVAATPEALAELAALAQRPRCVAIGEIGLDYYHADNPDIATQQAAFRAQLRIAAAARKPILIHCRNSDLARPEAKRRFGAADAWQDLLAILGEDWQPHTRGDTAAGILHCFSGGIDQARHSLDLGFHLSFAGNLTYPSATALREAAAFAPAGRILIETDAPFLAPIPHRGQTNEPAFVAHTAAALAALRGLSLEELADLTTGNFHRLFALDMPEQQA